MFLFIYSTQNKRAFSTFSKLNVENNMEMGQK